jgi:hypothetical protein
VTFIARRTVAVLIPPSRRKIGEHLSLAGLDALITEAERCLRLSREGGYEDLISIMKSDIRDEYLPKLMVLLHMTDGADRLAVAERIKRVRRMLQ